jgi:hypothetical protein
MSRWEEALWSELDEMPLDQQVVSCGEWITHLTREVLPKLGKVRRRRILEILAQDDWDATKLAETIGSRTSTIKRLAEEGRAQARVAATHPSL